MADAAIAFLQVMGARMGVVRELTVMVMCNPGTIVIDQGAEPISAPCLLMYTKCTWSVHTCMYLCM